MFTPKMYLKQPGFTYSASGPFTKHKESTKITPLKAKKNITPTANGFQKVLGKSIRKPNKIWVHSDDKFYNK